MKKEKNGTNLQENYIQCRCGGFNDNCYHCSGSGMLVSAFNLEISSVPSCSSRPRARYSVADTREEKINLQDSRLSGVGHSLLTQPSVWSQSKILEEDLRRKQLLDNFLISLGKQKKGKRKNKRNLNKLLKKYSKSKRQRV